MIKKADDKNWENFIISLPDFVPSSSSYDKNRAYYLCSKAIKNGELVRKPCVVCGNEISEIHHEDYSKPLDVIWLCDKHHALLTVYRRNKRAEFAIETGIEIRNTSPTYILRNIDESFWKEVKTVAFREHTTIRALIIKILRKYLKEHDSKGTENERL